jgi:hypothetical protein
VPRRLGGFGPDPEECVTALRERGVPTVQGNYDHSIGHRLADCACGYTDADDQRFAQLSYDFTDAQVSEGLARVAALAAAEAPFTLAGLRVCCAMARRAAERVPVGEHVQRRVPRSDSATRARRMCLACSHTGFTGTGCSRVAGMS